MKNLTNILSLSHDGIILQGFRGKKFCYQLLFLFQKQIWKSWNAHFTFQTKLPIKLHLEGKHFSEAFKYFKLCFRGLRCQFNSSLPNS